MNGVLNLMLTSINYELIGWTLLHSIWQLTVIGFVYWIFAALLRNRSPQTIYVFGCVTLAAMLIVPLATGACCLDVAECPTSTSKQIAEVAVENIARDNTSPVVANPVVMSSPSAIDFAANKPTEKTEASWTIAVTKLWLASWIPTLTWLWIAGVLFASLRTLTGLFAVRRLRTRGLTDLSIQILAHGDSLAGLMKVSYACQFAGSTLVKVPTVVGYFKPLILLPASAISGLTIQELETIIAHELGHVRRHDYLVNFIQTVIETLLFYHPAVWLISRKVRIQRENCCDDIAVAVCGCPVTYARALEKLESGRSMSGSLALAASDNSLIERIGRLLGHLAYVRGADFNLNQTQKKAAGRNLYSQTASASSSEVSKRFAIHKKGSTHFKRAK